MHYDYLFEKLYQYSVTNAGQGLAKVFGGQAFLMDKTCQNLLVGLSMTHPEGVIPLWLLCSSRVYSVRPLQLAGHFDVLDGSNGSCGQGS